MMMHRDGIKITYTFVVPEDHDEMDVVLRPKAYADLVNMIFKKSCDLLKNKEISNELKEYAREIKSACGNLR